MKDHRSAACGFKNGEKLWDDDVFHKSKSTGGLCKNENNNINEIIKKNVYCDWVPIRRDQVERTRGARVPVPVHVHIYDRFCKWDGWMDDPIL